MPSVVKDDLPQGKLLGAVSFRSSTLKRHEGSRLAELLLVIPGRVGFPAE